MADLSEALAAIMGRLSDDESIEDQANLNEAHWFAFTRSEIPFSIKPGPRSFLRLQAEDVGMTTLYPRTSLKGDSPLGGQLADLPFPYAVIHRAHSHQTLRCPIDKDATVLASVPRTAGSYLLRGRIPVCTESDPAWLGLFRAALDDLASTSHDSSENNRDE